MMADSSNFSVPNPILVRSSPSKGSVCLSHVEVLSENVDHDNREGNDVPDIK